MLNVMFQACDVRWRRSTRTRGPARSPEQAMKKVMVTARKPRTGTDWRMSAPAPVLSGHACCGRRRWRRQGKSHGQEQGDEHAQQRARRVIGQFGRSS